MYILLTDECSSFAVAIILAARIYGIDWLRQLLARIYGIGGQQQQYQQQSETTDGIDDDDNDNGPPPFLPLAVFR